MGAIDPSMIGELRAMFEDGATPSRLIRHVLERHPDDPHWDFLARHYFREGFGVPMLRITAETEPWERQDLTFAGLNAATLHWMAAFRDAPRPTWLGDVTVTDRDTRRAQAPVPPPELATLWPALAPAARDCVTRLMRSSEELHDQVQILARLAERLQQKLTAAEAVTTQGAAGE